MALRISKNVGLTDLVSTGDNSNPIQTQHPIAGSTVSVQAWLFNDNAAERFENINIDPTDAVSTDESTWVQLSADGSTWLGVGEALTMANISDTNVAKPFWYRVVAPSVGSAQNKTDIKLTVNFRKFAV